MNEKKTEHQYFEKYARPDGRMGVRKDEQTGGHVDGHEWNIRTEIQRRGARMHLHLFLEKIFFLARFGKSH